LQPGMGVVDMRTMLGCLCSLLPPNPAQLSCTADAFHHYHKPAAPISAQTDTLWLLAVFMSTHKCTLPATQPLHRWPSHAARRSLLRRSMWLGRVAWHSSGQQQRRHSAQQQKHQRPSAGGWLCKQSGGGCASHVTSEAILIGTASICVGGQRQPDQAT
jgi:hypothetical protein